MTPPFQILCLCTPLPDLAMSAYGPFVLHPCSSLADITEQLHQQPRDAALIGLPTAADADRLMQWTGLPHAVLQTALVVVTPEPKPVLCTRLLQLGIGDLLPTRDATPETVARVLRLTIERKRLADEQRRAYSIDLTTGLPNHMQLLEHMTHLLALREREPAAMALIVLHLDGFRAAEDAGGPEAANVLRRKAAVRLRASLRASDVVASLGSDMFAVLLAWIESEDDSQRVAAKLLQSLHQPFHMAGRDVLVSATIGLGQYPAHGRDANALLRLAVGQATSGGIGRVLGTAAAANDDAALPG
jgi:diguanylate cyclase (GGDEF)-like protein